MKKIVFMLTLLVAAVGAEAKYWKIGPGSVAGMDFASINAAMESTNVNEGDTLYLDQYYSTTDLQTITKKVVVIGTGYDTSLTDEQVVATISRLNIKSDDVTVKSVKLSSVCLYNSNCTIDRCFANSICVGDIVEGINHIYSSYLSGTTNSLIDGSFVSQNVTYFSRFDIQNCVIKQSYSSSTNSYMVNNTIYGLDFSLIKNNIIYRYEYVSNTDNRSYFALSGIKDSEIVNNYIYGYGYYRKNYNTTYEGYGQDLSSEVISVNSGNTIEHNVLSRSSLSNFLANKVGYNSLSSIFVCSGSFSDYYRLLSSSPAHGYATDGGEVGCHGGMFGCPSGGRPQYIPYFTKVTVGSRSEDGKLPVSVTIKIQDE